MSPLQTLWRRLRPLLAAVVFWLALHSTALAAKPKANEGIGDSPGAGPWVAPYAVLLLGIVLGLLGVCLSSRRRDRDKPETFASKTTLSKGK